MNKSVTSKEELLKTAKNIVFEEGIENLNIRLLANKCGISIGSVYNYFPSKADLIFALVEDYWQSIFHPKEYKISNEVSFVDFISELYKSFAKHLEKFKTIYYGQMTLMKSKDKKQGKEIEEQYFSRVYDYLYEILEKDNKVLEEVWTEDFTKEDFIKFVINNMFILIRKGKSESGFLLEVIRKLIY